MLRYHLAFHNRNFEIAPRIADPAWRAVDDNIDDIICWTYPRVVRNDNTVGVEGTRLQIVLPSAHEGWARRRVVLARRLDGSWFATLQETSVPAIPVDQPKPTRLAA